jgi:deoxyribonuclease V
MVEPGAGRMKSAATWPRSSYELATLQRALAAERPPPWHPDTGRPLLLGGCFCCFPRGVEGGGGAGDQAWAAAVTVASGRVVASVVRSGTAGAPYRAGMLALREGPLLEVAVRQLGVLPEVLLVNATGRDHPRSAGLALHLGAVLDLPTVGVTHRPLHAVGAWPPDQTGAASPLMSGGTRVADWVRTRAGSRPLVAHAAWRTDPGVAVEVVRLATGAYRTPIPLREARHLARRART